MRSRLWIRPNFGHALAQGGLAGAIALILALPQTWVFLGQATQTILSLGGIPSVLVPTLGAPTLYVPTVGGTLAAFNILLECSGLVTVAIFGFLLAATMGLLQGPFWFKALWASVGAGMGVFWNVNRLVLSASTAHYFGMDAFALVHFLFAPMVDFLWMVVVWSVGMSLMSRWAPEVPA